MHDTMLRLSVAITCLVCYYCAAQLVLPEIPPGVLTEVLSANQDALPCERAVSPMLLV